MLRPSPNHGTQRLPNDDDDDTKVKGMFVYCVLSVGPYKALYYNAYPLTNTYSIFLAAITA